MTAHERDSSGPSYSHGSSRPLTPHALEILTRGLAQLLDMTEGLEFRPLPSEKHPLPLTRMVFAGPLEACAIRRDVQSRMHSDPVAALENALVLLELYESNQPDVCDYVLEDMPFCGACFATKRASGWAYVVGDTDRSALESAVNSRWQFKFIPGPPRPTGLYALLNRLARYAFVYGRIPYGDFHAASHFIEEHGPAVLVCRGLMSDLELTLSLAAMKMGLPAVVPSDYPFPLGRTLRLDSLSEIADNIVAFPNVHRLLQFPEIPQMPEYCSHDYLSEKFEAAQVWGDSPESFLILRKGPVSSPAVTATGQPQGPMGVIVTVDAEPLEACDRRYIERRIAISPALMHGVMAAYNGDRLLIRIAPGVTLDPCRIGEVLIAALRNEFPRITHVGVEIIFDRPRLAGLAPFMRGEKLQRARDIKSSTEETLSCFVTCTGCSPFAPDHVCVVTPERPPQCGREYEKLRTGALYGYDDMTNIHHSALHRDLNSFAVAEKGLCIDPLRGEYAGVNAAAARLTHGRTRRIQLHCLDECPTTGCGCFSLIMFKTDAPRPGIGIMDNGFGDRAPDGRSWKDLYYALAGKQAPGLSGASPAYLFSPKFLRAHSGWKSIVWVSPKVATIARAMLSPDTLVG